MYDNHHPRFASVAPPRDLSIEFDQGRHFDGPGTFRTRGMNDESSIGLPNSTLAVELVAFMALLPVDLLFPSRQVQNQYNDDHTPLQTSQYCAEHK